ncbi:unnamed protein product [Pieris macdunnoughi]|uniref:DUF1279 domain-containing protein n=1 Tax=Pieris macdunnoughi TaxID=345717 RepID=A0A821M010_9NEOP|nr:unnamed protein product [Pieris macdunnoughi]
MLKVYSRINQNFYPQKHLPNTYFGGSCTLGKTIHNTISLKFPQVAALKLPTNVVNINATEMGSDKLNMKIDITVQSDPYVNKYDCRGAVNLSSSMQSNVPSPFSGNHTHLGMPGSQWGQGYKYLSDNLQSAHYLTLRNEYRGIIGGIGTRKMSANASDTLSAKDKLKKAVKDYGATVIVFHVSISLMSLGICYVLVSSGVDLVAVMKYFNIGEGKLSNMITSNAGTFVIAYAIHKVLAPARIGITLTSTPFIVQYLRNKGILKATKVNKGGGN